MQLKSEFAEFVVQKSEMRLLPKSNAKELRLMKNMPLILKHVGPSEIESGKSSAGKKQRYKKRSARLYERRPDNVSGSARLRRSSAKQIETTAVLSARRNGQREKS